MRYMISVIDTKTRSGHSPEEIAAIDAVNEEMVKHGYRLLAEGIDAPEKARVFDFRSGNSSVKPGPLHSTEEFFSGIWVVDVPSEEIAIELAEKGSRACNRKVELRPFLR